MVHLEKNRICKATDYCYESARIARNFQIEVYRQDGVIAVCHVT
jgi:hypothetical protein